MSDNTTLQVWQFLDRVWSNHDPMPTVREVQAELGLSSSSVAEYHMLKLEAAKIIERQRGKSRHIRLLKPYKA